MAAVVSLDSPAQLFMLGSVVAYWYWRHSIGRQAWQRAVITGVLAGAAFLCKESAILAVAGLMLMALFGARTSWRELGAWACQTAVSALTALVVVVLGYAPFGSISSRIDYMLRFQQAHSTNGHIVGYAGQVGIHPPWWTNFWFAGHSLGWPTGLALSAGALGAVLLVRTPITRWLAVSLAAPIAFHCFYAQVALSYYWILWLPAVAALAAIGLTRLAQHAARSHPPHRAAFTRVAVLAAAAALVVPAATAAARINSQRVEGAMAVAAYRSNQHLTGVILATGVFTDEFIPAVAPARVVTAPPANLNPIDSIVLARPRCRITRAPTIRALIAVNVTRHALVLVLTDRLDQLFVVTAPLHKPTLAEIAAEPHESLAASC